jgi:acetyl esterase/lipase
MKNQQMSLKNIFKRSIIVAWTSLFFVAALSNAFMTAQTVSAATINPQTYCSTYTVNIQINACKEGLRGGECNNYVELNEQEAADACYKAFQVAADPNTVISDTPVDDRTSTDKLAYTNTILKACQAYRDNTSELLACMNGGMGENDEGKPREVSDCIEKYKSSNRNQNACINGATAGQRYEASQEDGEKNSGIFSNQNTRSFQDMLDQSSDLSEYVDKLHETGQDSDVDLSDTPDDTPGSYINGAGQKQAVNVHRCLNTEGDCPAIIWFNGGGWHANDGTAYCLATGSSQKNCAPGADGGGDIGVGDRGAPPGGGANARGYTVVEVTYRLGSSGVYYMFEDVMRGIQHVINMADEYGIDPSNIVIGGDSAGGSLSMRAAASGKSGAKAAIGWSAPTNGYTGLFRSFESFAIGMDHSTCIPTDLAGFTNFTDLLNGGSGEVAEYGQGLSSNDFSNLGITQGNSGIGFDGGSIGSAGGVGTVMQVLTAAQYASQTSQNIESITSQMQSGQSLPIGNIVNLSAKKLIECVDNFNVLSPALFASPETPPSVLAGFDSDKVVGPEQAYAMRDKLRALGVRSEAIIIPGDAGVASAPLTTGDNHLGYDPRFVCETINFIDEIIRPELTADQIDCVTGQKSSQASAPTTDAGNGDTGGGAGQTPSNSNPGTNTPSAPTGDPCKAYGTCEKDCSNVGGPSAINNCELEKSRNECNNTPGKQWINGSCTTNKPREPNCTGPSYWNSSYNSCVYSTDSSGIFSNPNSACGSARFLWERNGTALCAVGEGAF